MKLDQIRSYFNDSFFYLNHIIDINTKNRGNIDHIQANACLNPYHTLVRFFWNNKTVRYFRVNPDSGLVEEKIKKAPLLLIKGVRKYLQIMLYIALAIPGLLLGAYYRRKALLNKDIERSFMLLNMKLKYEQKVGQFAPLDKTQPVPFNKLHKDVFLFALTFLDEEAFKNVRRLSHCTRVLIDTIDATGLKALGNPKWLLPIDREKLNGLDKTSEGDNTPMRLAADAWEYQQKHGYSSAIVKGLEFKNILNIPLVRFPQIEKPQGSAQEALSLLNKEIVRKINKKGPYKRVFRLSYNRQEYLVARYALTIPAAMTKNGQSIKCEGFLICQGDDITEVNDRRGIGMDAKLRFTNFSPYSSALKEDLTDFQLQSLSWDITLSSDAKEKKQLFVEFAKGACFGFKYLRHKEIFEDLITKTTGKDGSSVIKIGRVIREDCFGEIAVEDWD